MSDYVYVVSYVDDGSDCYEMFDTADNAQAYVALLEAGKARPLYESGSAWVDEKAVRGANWVRIYSV